ncbi:MAG: alcohol dehydrogenase catalytic domain-containing protein, partial [Gemmatimonadota bacterium]
MRSARLVEPNRFDVEWREAAPEPGPDEVLVRVRGCGVCASNLGPWTGDAGIAYPLPPGAPGHEVYGTVAAFGSDVRGIEVGAAVTALSHHGFADYDLVGADAVVPLPDAVADRPLPGEPVACAVNVARRADVEAGDDVVVLGAGFLGTLVVRLARHAGAGRIVADYLDSGGDPDELKRSLGGALLREDAGFHTRQNVEAAFAQHALAETAWD